jgi:hypothetical protein
VASPAGKITICNRALQLLGAKRIADLTDNTVSARACNVCYDPLRQAELEKHWWRFAIKRAQLAAVSPAPTWGRANAFQLPSDYLKLFKPYPEDATNTLDYEIEGTQILSDWSAPLYIRYVWNVTDTNVMTALFKEALSAAMAVGMCEELTQSNTKKQAVAAIYDEAIKQARKYNAFETVPVMPPEDDWITARL